MISDSRLSASSIHFTGLDTLFGFISCRSIVVSVTYVRMTDTNETVLTIMMRNDRGVWVLSRGLPDR